MLEGHSHYEASTLWITGLLVSLEGYPYLYLFINQGAWQAAANKATADLVVW